jgi:lipopolysaccharide export system permease protein
MMMRVRTKPCGGYLPTDSWINYRYKMRAARYLTYDVVTHTGAVSLVLFLVVFSGRFIKYLAEAAIGDLSAGILLPIMLYKLPAFFELILPLGFYIGVLLSFGRLYADSEMVIFRASGTSQWQLFSRISTATIATTLLVATLALVLGPNGAARANALLAEPRSAEGMHVLAEGRFKKQRAGDYVTYVEQISDDGKMNTVFVAERQRSESGTVLSTTLAESGAIEIDPESGRRYLQLSNGHRYSVSPGKAELTQARFNGYRSLIPEIEGGLRSQAQVETLPTPALIGSDNPEHIAILGWRISLALIVPVMVLFAIPLSQTDSRRGRYAKLGPALIVFLLYFVALSQARSMAEESGSLVVFVVVHSLFAVVGVALMLGDDLRRLLKGDRSASGAARGLS